MEEPGIRDGAEDSPSRTEIPVGLNRIKTRGANESDQKLDGSLRSAGGISRPPVKQKHTNLAREHMNSIAHREGFHKGKKLAKCFTPYRINDSNQAFGADSSNVEPPEHEFRPFDESPIRKVNRFGKHLIEKQFSLGCPRSSEVSNALKCFSNELDPDGDIHPAHPRAHSYGDLKELLGSLSSRFDAAKEVVNTELKFFSQEVMEILKKDDSFHLEEQKTAEELLGLSQQCIEMTCLEFRKRCEAIVQDLTEKRKRCQVGLLKWLLTRMLYILTRFTRLLYYAKDGELVNERSLDKFKECLDRIPCIEMSCLFHQECEDIQEKSPYQIAEILDKFEGELIPIDICDSPQEQETYRDDSKFVICRICEEAVPTTHLESHSYICAYADKCDSKCFSVDERLLNIAELLDQLLDSHNSDTPATYDSPEYPKMQSTSPMTLPGNSPNLSDWRSKGVDGMIEDLHEMDTACIEDYQPATLINLTTHLGAKLTSCGPPSSAGSITSASSTNTPRAVNFDVFWVDNVYLSELEDPQQITDLADIARCVVSIDLTEEGSRESLLACMQNLQDILQQSKVKALIIDIFGGRIENLLREKYVCACNLLDRDSDTGHLESSKLVQDHESQSSSATTPSHPFKERTSIDDFEIVKPISKGAFGKVFLARKRKTGDFFAIKVLKKMDMLRKNDIQRILAERNILITVRNPFVVRFFYSFTSRDNLYLVMEYLNGGDIYSLLKKVGSLEEDIARVYVAELVLALEYLHSLGIVHRDLKPDNILIAHDGHIKLTDFGLSEIGLMNGTDSLSGPETGETILSHPNHKNVLESAYSNQRSAVGTPDYLAPEILLGSEHGYAADWWSAGIILFELITGIPPFTAEHPERIFENILNRKIPWPSVPSEMSYEAQELIDRLLIHDPNLRIGARGTAEVKAHPFFKGVDWENLALQKAAFVPQPDSPDDTSYFMARYDSTGICDDKDCISLATDSLKSHPYSENEIVDESYSLARTCSSLGHSLMKFSFKNLSQLASINHDMLVQSTKDSSKCSSPSEDLDL